MFEYITPYWGHANYSTKYVIIPNAHKGDMIGISNPSAITITMSYDDY